MAITKKRTKNLEVVKKRRLLWLGDLARMSHSTTVQLIAWEATNSKKKTKNLIEKSGVRKYKKEIKNRKDAKT